MNKYLCFDYFLTPELYILISKNVNKNQKKLEIHYAIGSKIMQQYTNLYELVCGENNIIYDFDIKCENTLKKLNCGNNRNFSDNLILKCKYLESLKCGGNHNFTDECFKNLAKLRKLNCGNNRNFTDKIFKFLPNLESLNCGKKWEYPLSLDEIKSNKLIYGSDVYYVSQHRSNFTNEGLINTCKKLKKLNCGKNQNLSDFSGLINLEKLILQENCAGGNKREKTKLIKGNRIKYLDLQNERDFNDELLMMCPNLEVLLCGKNTKITNKGMLKLTKLKKLIFDQRIEEITDEGLINIRNLEELYLGYMITITEKTINNQKNLKFLEIYSSDSFIDINNVNVKNLIKLGYDNTRRNNQKINYSRFENIEELNIRDNKICDDDIINLKKIKKLIICSTNESGKISNNSIDKLKNLRYLSIPYIQTEIDLLTLKNPEKFKYIELKYESNEEKIQKSYYNAKIVIKNKNRTIITKNKIKILNF